MKKTVITLTLLLGTLAAGAQQEVDTWSIIPRVGVNLSNLTNNDITSLSSGLRDNTQESKYKAGMKVGVDVEYQVTPTVAVSAGVYYSMQGCRFTDYNDYLGTETDEHGQTLKNYLGTSDMKEDRQYITVPIMAHVYLAKNFAVSAGVQPGFLLKSEMSWNDQYYNVATDGTRTYEKSEETTVDTDEVSKKFDLSIPVGLSYEYENVMLSARYNIGLTKAMEPDCKNKTFEFTVGYRFAL